jgi:hypothetical protein
MPFDGRNRVTIFGPKADGAHVIEFRTVTGEALATLGAGK